MSRRRALQPEPHGGALGLAPRKQNSAQLHCRVEGQMEDPVWASGRTGVGHGGVTELPAFTQLRDCHL